MGIVRARQMLTADEVFDLVRDDLRDVEEAIRIESFASVDTVMPIWEYLQPKDGERLRAALLLLCFRLAGGVGSNRVAIQLGAVVEMLYAAALAHEDVIDVSEVHCGQTSSNVQRAECTSVLAGDWLYLRAFRVALQERVLHLAIGAGQMMAMGELIQLNRIGCIDITEADCIKLVDHKTASLFSICGKLGAVTAGINIREEEKLSEFAWNLGMAFQLIDDTLDFVSRESTLGKTPGSDLVLGKVTLPLVYALEQASECERNLVSDVLRDRSYDAISFENVLALVDRYEGIQRTHTRARQFSNRARQIIAEFPDSLWRHALYTLSDLVTDYDR